MIKSRQTWLSDCKYQQLSLGGLCCEAQLTLHASTAPICAKRWLPIKYISGGTCFLLAMPGNHNKVTALSLSLWHSHTHSRIHQSQVDFGFFVTLDLCMT